MVMDILDVIDGIVDDTHPEGDGCPLCISLDDLRERLEALEPWLNDIARCHEAAFAEWEEAHAKAPGALAFEGTDGPFCEAMRSTRDRLRDFHFELSRRVQ